MVTGIQIGGGELVDERLLVECRDHGFGMLRVQTYTNDRPHFTLTPAALTTQIAEQPLAFGMHPLVTIRDAKQIDDLPNNDAVFIEAANEPDLEQFGWTKATYRNLVMACIERCEHRTNRLCIGSISNLDDDSLHWLRTALPWNEIPAHIIEAYHRYPYDNRGPTIGHHKSLLGGRWSRDKELGELQRIVGSDRMIALSEVGYHELEFSEEAAAQHFEWERNFLERTGHLFGCAYQVVDGVQSSSHYEDHFGFKDIETGRWKAQTKAWTGVSA